jgi:hypothetical protein
MVEFAAFQQALQDFGPAALRRAFPQGVPAEPILQINTDNTSAMAWCNKAATKGGDHGKNLVRLFAEMLLSSHVGLKCSHIAGTDNVLADDISRPLTLCHGPPKSRFLHLEQLFATHPLLKDYKYFHLGKEFKSALQSALYSSFKAERPKLPNKFGLFARVVSTSSNFSMI